MTDVTQIAYPPLDSQATQSFISDNVTDPSGDNPRDFRTALFNVLESSLPSGSKPNDFSIDDLWKRYILEVIASDPNNLNQVVISDPVKPLFPGMPIQIYLPIEITNNDGNAYGFPSGSSEDIINFTPYEEWSHTSVVEPECGCFSPLGDKIYFQDDTTNRPFYEIPLSGSWNGLPADNTGLTADGSTGRTQSYQCMQMRDDGLRLFACANDDIHEFTLTTAYDISTLTSTNGETIHAFDTAFEAISAVIWFRFSPDGTKLFVLGNTTSNGLGFYGYDLDTAWDLTSYTGTPPDEIGPENVTNDLPLANQHEYFITSDGTKLVGTYDSPGSDGALSQINLSGTAFDISTFQETGYRWRWGTLDSEPIAAYDISEDGQYMLMIRRGLGSTSDMQIRIYANSGNSAYLSRFFETGDLGYAPGGSIDPQACYLDQDGDFFVLFHDDGGNDLNRYDMTTPFDWSTASLGTGQTFATTNRWRGGIARNADGTKYMAYTVADTIDQITMTTGDDLTTATETTGISWGNAPVANSDILGFWFNNDGTIAYTMIQRTSDSDYIIGQTSLSTAYDITTNSASWTYFNLTDELAVPTPGGLRGFNWNSDGTKLIAHYFSSDNWASDEIHSWSASPAYDVSGLVHDDNLFCYWAGNTSPQGLSYAYDSTNDEEYLGVTLGTTVNRFQILQKDKIYENV